MKILLVFIDMVRLDRLNVFNKQVQPTPLDEIINRIGGTLYTKCYTPAPDTPRSLACMQTGLLPYANGCDTRIKWPRFFIKDRSKTIWSLAASKGYKVNLCARQHYIDTGMFSYLEHENIRTYNSFESFVKDADFTNNSLSYVGTPDIHLAVDDMGGTNKALRAGFSKAAKMFDKYLTDKFLDMFDYVIVFSDHGLQLESERRKQHNKLDLLGDGRTRLLMFLHKKGDVGVNKDNRLASMVDLFATVSNIINAGATNDGYSFLETPKRTITHIEDHTDFSVKPEVMIKQWRVISDEFDARTNVYNAEGISREEDKITMDNYLTANSPCYTTYVNQLKIWELYDQLKKQDQETYFVGDKRIGKVDKIIGKSIRRAIGFVYKKLKLG